MCCISTKFFLNFQYCLQKLLLKKMRTEVGDDLSICVMNILPKVISLPSLLAINFRKIEI